MNNPVEKRFCGKCGAEMNAEQQFCPKCGNPAPVAQPQPVPETAASVAQPQPVPEAPAPVAQPQSVPETSAPVMQTQSPVSVGAPSPTDVNASAYTPPVEEPKKKKNKLVPVLVFVALVVVCVVIGVVRYYNSDAYKYKQALELLNNGKYELAYEMLDDLGDYEDAESYLPFHGRYNDSDTDSDSYMEFLGNKYKYHYFDSDGKERTSEGSLQISGYSFAEVTYSSSEKKTFRALRNYVFNTDGVFNEDVVVTDGKIDATLRIDYDSIELDAGTICAYADYTFETDGTYTEKFVVSYKGDEENASSSEYTGFYKVDEEVVELTHDEDETTEIFVIVDGKMYTDVFVRAD